MCMNVYLDIDGVLLANELNAANHVHEFLSLIKSRYPDSTYWLTTHVKGDPKTAIERLSKVFKPETMKLIQDIQPTNWQIAKTEAIDFSQPFLWFDDDLFEDERKALIENKALDNWIEVDLSKDENQLEKFIISFPLSTPVV